VFCAPGTAVAVFAAPPEAASLTIVTPMLHFCRFAAYRGLVTLDPSRLQRKFHGLQVRSRTGPVAHEGGTRHDPAR